MVGNSITGGICMIHASNIQVSGRLEAFSVTVEKGEIIALLGGDKAGKTTVLDALTGVCEITGGEAEGCSGAYMTRKSPLFEDMTLRANLKFACDLEGLAHAKADERIRAAADRTGISEYLDKPANVLSLSVQRRCALALALLFEDENLYLDEPTRDLESAEVLRIRRIIRQAAEDKAVLLCTRSVTEAEKLADRIYIMKEGRILARCEKGQLDQAVQAGVMRARIRGSEEEALAAGAQRAEKCPVGGCVDAIFPCEDEEALLRALLDKRLRILEFAPAPMDVDELVCALEADAFPGEAEQE